MLHKIIVFDAHLLISFFTSQPVYFNNVTHAVHRSVRTEVAASSSESLTPIYQTIRCHITAA
jgi:hypothetical protein